MTRTVPVLILTGYLGAGKTTVLNHFLATGRGRIGVVINDFGDVNVDAGLVAGHVADPVSIAGGCLCCIEDPAQLDDALRTLSRPALDLDAIVIEGSGLAEPPALIQLVIASTVAGVRFGGLVEVVDAAHTAHAEAGGWDLVQHVRAAAVVLLTKTDLAEPGEVAGVRGRIGRANPLALVLDAPHGAADPRLFFDTAERTVPEGGQLPLWEFGTAPAHAHEHHVRHRAESLEVAAPVRPAALADLLSDPPDAVHRIKAVVDVLTARGLRRFVGHSVAGHVSVERTARDPNAPAHSVVVAIGPAWDDDAVRTRLEAVAPVTSAAAVPVPPARDLRRLTRFLRR